VHLIDCRLDVTFSPIRSAALQITRLASAPLPFRVTRRFGYPRIEHWHGHEFVNDSHVKILKPGTALIRERVGAAPQTVFSSDFVGAYRSAVVKGVP
jgi:hypothetical protein